MAPPMTTANRAAASPDAAASYATPARPTTSHPDRSRTAKPDPGKQSLAAAVRRASHDPVLGFLLPEPRGDVQMQQRRELLRESGAVPGFWSDASLEAIASGRSGINYSNMPMLCDWLGVPTPTAM